MTAHAPFSPSAAHRWLRCPQSARYAQILPSPPPGEAARIGTEMHARAERHLREGDDSTCSGLQLYLNVVRGHVGPHLIERKVEIVPELCWGTADCIAQDAVIDFKWGKQPVSAVSNEQLSLYALGMQQWEPRQSWDLVIVQPNAKSGPPVKHWTATAHYLNKFHDQVLRAIDRAHSDKLLVIAGQHCRWCSGNFMCDEAMVTGF